MAETDLIDWLRRRINHAESVAVGPGDDAAVIIPQPGSHVVVTADAFLEGVHFAPDDDPRDVGHKVIAAAVSDVAAMGCYPLHSVVTLAMTRSRGDAFVRTLGEAMIGAAAKYAAPIVGGDVTAWDRPIAVSVTVVGETRGLRPVLRSGARQGDRIFVTGELGGSLLGRHLNAPPRVTEALFLNQTAGVTAMIDVSDGLSTDLNHLARESGVGAVVLEAAIPVSDAARTLAGRDGVPALQHALDDGADFELLFTVPPDRADALTAQWPFDLRLTEIGRIEGGHVLLERPDGTRQPLTPHGYEHRWSE